MAARQLKIMYNNIKALNEVCETDKAHFSVFKLYLFEYVEQDPDGLRDGTRT